MNIESPVKTAQIPEERPGGQLPREDANSGRLPAPLPHIERILVAVDFSESSKAALEYALSVADKFNSAVALVHAVEPCVYPEDLAAGISVDEIDARWTKKKKEELEAFRRAAIKEGRPSTLIVTRGTAWAQIVETAKSWPANLIVIGTRGLTGLKHVLVGSTAERVVRHATCPVLVVHAAQK